MIKEHVLRQKMLAKMLVPTLTMSTYHVTSSTTHTTSFQRAVAVCAAVHQVQVLCHRHVPAAAQPSAHVCAAPQQHSTEPPPRMTWQPYSWAEEVEAAVDYAIHHDGNVFEPMEHSTTPPDTCAADVATCATSATCELPEQQLTTLCPCSPTLIQRNSKAIKNVKSKPSMHCVLYTTAHLTNMQVGELVLDGHLGWDRLDLSHVDAPRIQVLVRPKPAMQQAQLRRT